LDEIHRIRDKIPLLLHRWREPPYSHSAPRNEWEHDLLAAVAGLVKTCERAFRMVEERPTPYITDLADQEQHDRFLQVSQELSQEHSTLWQMTHRYENDLWQFDQDIELNKHAPITEERPIDHSASVTPLEASQSVSTAKIQNGDSDAIAPPDNSNSLRLSGKI